MEDRQHVVEHDRDPGPGSLLHVGATGTQQVLDVGPWDPGPCRPLEYRSQRPEMFLSDVAMMSLFGIIVKLSGTGHKEGSLVAGGRADTAVARDPIDGRR